MKHILIVGAARPNFMKIKPIIDAFDSEKFSTILVHTGQHHDPDMSDVFFSDLGLRPPDHHLGVSGGTHAEQTARVMVSFADLLSSTPVDIVVVVGDVNATLACSLTAAKMGVPVAHVEAGLRSRDWSMPEEVNRVVTDRVSDLLFAPSSDAAANLKAEGYRDDQIHLVGNVMIDTLLANLERAEVSVAQTGLVPAHDYGLLTLHRPSNVDDLETLRTLFEPLIEASRSLPLIFPVHPRARANVQRLGLPSSIIQVSPLGYLQFIGLMAGARVVMTDSGGIQEETTVLGIPCITLRDNTERPITVEQGTNVLVGRDSARLLAAFSDALTATPTPRRPDLWDGRAATRIAQVIQDWTPLKRPTDL